MTKFAPALIASVQYAAGITVFRKPEATAGGPMLSCIIVLIAVCLLLWTLPIYPRGLRKPVAGLNGLTEYVLSVFYVETIMALFWFPLESTILSFLPLLATSIEETLWNYQLSCLDVYSFMKTDAAKTCYSFLLSITILLGTLHATKCIKLELLSSGVQPFLHDILRRYKRFTKTFTKRIPSSQDSKKVKRNNQETNYCTLSEGSSDYEDTKEEDWQNLNNYYPNSKERNWKNLNNIFTDDE